MQTVAKKKGKFKKGQVKVTQGQRKKHISQMSARDVKVIQSGLNNLTNLYATKHVIKKIKHDNLWFTSDMIIDVIENVTEENIVEYNVSPFRKKKERRVLLRSTESYAVDIYGRGKIDCNICFVISLDRGALVTVYYNEENDHHETINLNRYDEKLKVI